MQIELTKTGEQMKEKFRLKINYDEINEDNLVLVGRLKDEGYDGAICIKHDNDGGYQFYENDADGRLILWSLADIPESWFTKIKKPVTIHDAWDSFVARNMAVDVIKPQNIFLAGWEVGIENEKLSAKIRFEEIKKEHLETMALNNVLYSDISVVKEAINEIFELMWDKDGT